MIISDAQPVQFWPVDCDTYNEKEVDGVFHSCYCAPWQCDDEIKIQLNDTEEYEVFLSAVDEEDNEFFNIDFEITPVGYQPPVVGPDSPITIPNLNTWANIAGSGTSWTTGSNPAVALVFAGSKKIAGLYSFVSGRSYTLTYELESSADWEGSIVTVHILDNSNNILESQQFFDLTGAAGTSKEFDFEFVAPSGATKLSISASRNFVFGGTTHTLTSVTGVEANVVTPEVPASLFIYSASFVPSTYDICDQKIALKIYRNESPDDLIFKSDCLDVQTEHENTELIAYSNNRVFAGLYFNTSSPDETFYLRVPAVFFHERYPEEDEVLKRSSDSIILNSTLEAQKLFETDYMPYYMHRKLQLVLKMQSIEIGNQTWVKQEAYEIQEGNKRWPKKMAKVWLNEADYVQRNVL